MTRNANILQNDSAAAADVLDAPRRTLQQLVRKCTVPTVFLRRLDTIELREAVRSSHLYAVSMRASLVEAVELLDQALAETLSPDEAVEASRAQ